MQHVLFKSKEEHWKWCYDNYFKYYEDLDPSPWDEEDRKILQPFFDWNAQRKGTPGPMSPEVQASFDYYDKVRDKGMLARERIDVVNRLEREQLLGHFGFERKYESDFETDEEYDEYLDSKEPPRLDIELSYPCVMVSNLIADYDRLGPVTKVVIDYVELKEFNPEEKTE